MDAFNMSILREILSDFRRVLAMRPHSPWQCAHAAQDEPTIERRGDGAAGVLNVANAFEKVVVDLADENSAEHIAMAAEIFRGRMQDDIDAEVERALDDRRPGIVANANRISGVSHFRDRSKIDNLQERIRRRFRPD